MRPGLKPLDALLSKRAFVWRHVLGVVASVQRRVRLAMYSVLIVVGVLSVLQAWQAGKSETVRLADAEIIRIAGAQSTLTQRMDTMAEQLAVADSSLENPENALGDTMNQAQDQAQRLEELLASQGALRPDAPPELRQAVEAWQNSRERLWYRAQLLLGQLDRNDPPRLLTAIKKLQAEIEPALLTTQVLVEQVQIAAQQRSHGAIGQIRLSGVLTVMLLLVLALGVGEPLARSLKRQYLALAAQSVELKRLALVAERTSNAVAILDARRRIVWVNSAFTRIHGYTMEETVGKSLGWLLRREQSDPAVLARFQAQLEQGQGIKGELLLHSKDGFDRWVGGDVQPLHDAAGALTGWVVVETDITEQVTQRLKMAAMLKALPAGVVLQTEAGVVLDCNPAATQILGVSRDALIERGSLIAAGRGVRDDLSEYPLDEQPYARTLKTGQGARGVSIGFIPDGGELCWLIVNTEPLTDAQGQLTGVMSCFVDVTARRAQQQWLTLAIEGAALGTWQWDVASGEMTCNDRMRVMLGYSREELDMTATAWNALIHPDDLAGWLASVKAHLRHSAMPLQRELRVKYGGHQWVWLMYRGTVVTRKPDGSAQRMAGIAMDVNAQKELEAQLRQAARTDGLTQLPNRAAVLDQIQAAISRARSEPGYRFAVLFMDFDRFKQVNDTLGHSVGDELLRQIALRLQDSLRSGDAVVRGHQFSQMAARIGGDEFVVVLDDIRDDQDAQAVAERLLDVLAQPYAIGAHRVDSSASIGIVTTAHAADEADSVLRDTDIAMYEAKREGRGRYVMFDPSMRKRVRDNVSLENDLRQALGKKELFVVYQPLVDLASGGLAGMEALVRWQHPKRGLISPVEFIPVAEASGLIGPIGRFVLKTACGDFANMQAALGAQTPRTMAVNLSRAQLRQPGLAAEVLDVLHASGVAPGQLILEVTESLAAQDELVLTTLRDLKARGIALSLDDFGTGYSSLSCLHELPVNIVKIDRSFVDLALTSDYHRVLIEATIRMAQTLGLTTVAEGIETAEQAALMKALGCGKGQGFLYSKPLPADALVQWIKALYEPVLY